MDAKHGKCNKGDNKAIDVFRQQMSKKNPQNANGRTTLAQKNFPRKRRHEATERRSEEEKMEDD